MTPATLRNRTFQVMSRAMETVERTGWDTTPRPLFAAPLFILGAPRSGTTLVYQCLVQHFDVGFFANVHQWFAHAPALVERVVRATRGPNVVSEFESHQGHTAGWASPSENPSYWYRFFRRTPQFVSSEDVQSAELLSLRGSMRSFIEACGRPIIIKNLPCALRLGPLANALPEALYLVIRRDELATARSILRARMQRFGSYEPWWSVEPPNVDQLSRLPPHMQVVGQIRAVYELVEQAAASHARARFCDLHYEQFCESTQEAMDKVACFLSENGVELSRRGNIPARFASRPAPVLEKTLLSQLESYCAAESKPTPHWALDR